MRNLANVDLEDPVEAECFSVIVGQLCEMSFRVLSAPERAALCEELVDPDLAFASPWVEFVIPDIVAFLQSTDPSPGTD